MFCFSAIRGAISKLDLFSSAQFLRYKGDAESKTFTGGLISGAVIVFLIVVFAGMIIDTFNKVIIASVTISNYSQNPAPVYFSTHDNGTGIGYMFSVELWGYDLNSGPRYFNIEMRNTALVQDIMDQNLTKVYEMEPCTKQHFSSIQNIDTLYEKLFIEGWLCFPLNQTFEASGSYNTDIQYAIDIVVTKCTNYTGQSRPCAPQADIDTFMSSQDNFIFAMGFTNPTINPEDPNYLTQVLETSYYDYFTDDLGAQMVFRNSRFQITTDESILPFSATHKDVGPILQKVQQSTYRIKNQHLYFQIRLDRSQEDIVVTREYQKIIDAFSYVGGLLGSFLILLIFISFYNENCYELTLGSTLFKSRTDSPATLHQYNLFYYFLHSLYSLLKTFKVTCQWDTTKYFQQSQSELQKQIDIQFILRKIHILESGMMLLFSKAQLTGLMLQHQLTIEEARAIRKMYESKKTAKKGWKSLNKEVQEQSKNVLSLNFLEGQTPQKNLPAEVDHNVDPTEEDLSSNSDSESSFEGDGEQNASNPQSFQQILSDFSELKSEIEQNHMSKSIFMNIDPRIRKMMEKVSKVKKSPPNANSRDPIQSENLEHVIRVEPALGEQEEREDNNATSEKINLEEDGGHFTFIQ